MRIKFIKPHPVIHKNKRRFDTGSPNFGASPIKAMNLIIQGYAVLVHSCKNCNHYHINPTADDYNKPFEFGVGFSQSYCKNKE